MIDILVMRLQAPMMAFGGPVIDERGPTERFPGVAALTGLLGNALGLSHADADALNRLQARLRPLCLDLTPEAETLTDYQTVDLSQTFMNGTGWTTRNRREDKGSGAATRGTHIRYRDHRVDSTVMVLLHLTPANDPPTVAALFDALQRPARPLFIGRKHCLPADFIGVAVTRAPNLFDAARTLLANGPPRQPHHDMAEAQAAETQTTGDQTNASTPKPPVWAEWTAGEMGSPTEDDERRLVDRRDWRNQIHGGERRVHRGCIHAGGAA